MKRLYLLMLLVLLAIGLNAQRGLFGIAYDAPLNTADSLLCYQGFLASEIEGNLITYRSDYNNFVDAIILIVDPIKEIVVGWFVSYNKDNTKEQDEYVLEQLEKIHGKAVYLDQEREKICWIFDEHRVAIYGYAPSGNLCIYYYDFSYPELFQLPPTVEQKIKNNPPDISQP
ncbi:MAG: hypothetical protein GX869_01025 [Candidatus Cloacimonetes bacterium]|jgi:hypothetical protein|nr:hypothetical protein [Candidatus Syntrophosphaera sp.]NLA44217.1 hypothetical protein [Candidatus Cloacimonadota bacterium]HNZ45333.1 hypothetical protein [Candidatus Syntrophosphaera thermopropionivorans]HOL33779.1 hypothetical protein [Candidatus Syntrophosphaera thermopropionivorans]HOQ82941.1 hypothetical protein [Candidatus Syntrophosphaera thermopropionivorans]